MPVPRKTTTQTPEIDVGSSSGAQTVAIFSPDSGSSFAATSIRVQALDESRETNRTYKHVSHENTDFDMACL